MTPSPSRFVTGLAIFVAILAVSTASIFIRFAQRDAPSIAIAAMRLTIASVALAPVALTRHRSQLAALTRQQLILGICSGLFLGLHFATWITSLEYTTVASSVVLVSTGPLWVALLSPLFLDERLTPGALVGLALALVGGAWISLGGSCRWDHGISCPDLSQVLAGHSIRGDLLALAGAWAVTGYLIIGRRLRAGIDLIPYVFLVYSIAALSLLLVMWILRIPAAGYHPMTYLWLLLLALLPQLVGHSTYNWALRYLPAAIVAVTTLGEPIGSATLAYFFLHEQPTMAVLAGAALILAGIYIAVRPQGKAAEQREYGASPEETEAVTEGCRVGQSRRARRAGLGMPRGQFDRSRIVGGYNAGSDMKLPAHLYLEGLGISYEARAFPAETEKGAAFVARMLGFPERRAVKTLIFQTDAGERVLVMLGGDQSAISSNLKRAVGSRNVRLASPEAVLDVTGYAIGSIPPFGWQPPGFRSFLERSLMGEPILGVGAGIWGNEILLSPDALVRATKALIVNLTDSPAV